MGASRVKGGIVNADFLQAFVNSQPEESDFALIGEIALNQTSLEYQIEALIWHYMEDVDKGHIATARLGSVSKADMLETFAEWAEPDDGVADSIAWGVKCFHILRDNRNSIIHGFNFRADRKAGKLTIERRTKSLVFDAFQVFEINRQVLTQVRDDQRSLAWFLWCLDSLFIGRLPGSIGPNLPPPDAPLRLPTKPALPASLSPLPHESPKSARRQRRELAEREAKRAKVESKERQRKAARERNK